MKIEGGCLCGAVRYTADAEPAFVGVCHCKNCQRSSGAAFGVVVALAKTALSLAGPLKTFEDRGDSGRALRRRFCPQCGSSLVLEAEALPDLVLVTAGSLDDTRWLRPQMEIFCDSAQPWVELGGGMRRVARMPE